MITSCGFFFWKFTSDVFVMYVLLKTKHEHLVSGVWHIFWYIHYQLIGKSGIINKAIEMCVLDF